MAELVLISGVGRSGTTLLQSMLNAHSQFYFPPETHFFKRYILPFLMGKKLPGHPELRKDRYLKRLPDEARQEILDSQLFSLEDLKTAFMRIVSPGKQRVEFLGDKDTEYVRYLQHLSYVFPEAYFVHIIRDPRDVVVSRLKTEWGRKRSFSFHAAEYQYYIKQVTEQGPKLFGARYQLIRYEDLLRNPEEELTKLLEIWGLNFEIQMLDFHLDNKGLVANDEQKWKQNLNKPLMKQNQGRWRKSLSPKQAALVQDSIEYFMAEYQYDLLEAEPSLVSKLRKDMYKLVFKGKTLKERLR